MKKQNRVAFFNILSTILLRGISMFTAPVFSRMLGTNGYGVISVYTIWMGVAATVFTLQTNGTLVNARVEYPEDQQHKYQSSVMFLSLVVFLAFSAVVVLFLPQISALMKLQKTLILLLLFHAFGNFCFNFMNSKFTYEFKADKNMIMSVGVTVVTLALSVILILLLPKEINYYGRILGMSLTYGIVGVVICIYILFKGKTFYNRTYWKLALMLALPVVFYSLSDILLGHCDRVMLQQMMSESMVGQYSLAFNFGGIMLTIFMALNNTWMPFFFDDMKAGRVPQIHNQAKNFLEIFTVLSVGFNLLSVEVYHVFASREFWAGTSLVPIFVTSYYLNFLCTFPVNYEYYHKKTKVVAVVTITSAVVNIVLNYVLISRIGMMGAALATGISHGFQFAMHYVYVRFVLHKGDYPFGVRIWAKYVAAYFAMVALVYLTPNFWLLRWGLGAAIGLWELWRIKKRKVLI